MNKAPETPNAAQPENASSMFSGAATGCTIRPILFSGPMVRAILAGEKTQTRRTVKPQPPAHHWDTLPGYQRRVSLLECSDGRIHARFQDSIPQNIDEPVWRKCPYGKPGDWLWVRETWAEAFNLTHDIDQETPMYRADYIAGKVINIHGSEVRWKPSIYMPRWASRVTLEITGIRVENLQDISDADSRAEGCATSATAARSQFRDLWDSINGPNSWSDNPCVWVVEFRKV
ncbi:MAG: hypothetical protein P1S60_20780 [Anaerolineae bacterium]|nr:hypothetical protein [Anaerolineae bacterium]